MLQHSYREGIPIMASKEHLNRFKECLELRAEGIYEWNLWRKKHSDIYPDLSGANFYGAHLIGANLNKTNLAQANLGFTNLTDADLSYANLCEASLIDANLSNANLKHANLSRAICVFTIFAEIDLRTVRGL